MASITFNLGKKTVVEVDTKQVSDSLFPHYVKLLKAGMPVDKAMRKYAILCRKTQIELLRAAVADAVVESPTYSGLLKLRTRGKFGMDAVLRKAAYVPTVLRA